MAEKTETGRFFNQSWASILVALFGGGVYLWQAWIYAHTQVSVLDEGLYLLKGYLFATGRYTPFQDYGPWTNHMPFSFLVPGYFQVWFGPGLRTGRMLAIALGILFLIAFWIVARRFGGQWWAAAAVWAAALNPAVIKIYSGMTSQVLVSCLLMWVFVLTLGEGRSRWQVFLGAFLAGLLPLTRLNLFPLLPLLLLYLAWEHGWQTGLESAAAGLIAFVGGHALFWPGILRLWAGWLPAGLTPFLDPWRLQDGGAGLWLPDIAFWPRVVSFFEGLRYHFLGLLGALTAWFLGFRLHGKVSRFTEFKAFIFLSVFFAVMLVAHIWAALLHDYCVFCFSSYLSFFGFTGFLILVLALSNWRAADGPIGGKWVWLLIILIMVGIGFSLYKSSYRIPALDAVSLRRLLSIPVPRISEGRLRSGTVPLLLLLENKTGYSLKNFVAFSHIFAVVVVGIFGTFLVLLLFRLAEKHHPLFLKTSNYPLSASVLLAFLTFGFFITPTSILGGGRTFYDCGPDTLAAYEQAGAHLAEVIPPGVQVYWKGGKQLAVLTYIADAEFFPPQFNLVYSYRDGGNPDDLERFGLWNESLDRRWVTEADYLLLAERAYTGWLQDYIKSSPFDEMPSTRPPNPCRPETAIRIYRRTP